MQYLVVDKTTENPDYYGPFDLAGAEQYSKDLNDRGSISSVYTLRPGKTLEEMIDRINNDYKKKVEEIEAKYKPKKIIISWIIWIVTAIGLILLYIYLSVIYHSDVAYTRGYLDKENGKPYWNHYDHRYEADEYRRGYDAATKHP